MRSLRTGRLCTPMLSAAALALAAGAIAIPTPAEAQVDEIIVTAQKRSQNLQDVPLAVTVVDGDLLERFNLDDLESVQLLVPSLTFRKGTTNLNSGLQLRGVGTISFSLGAEPSVSTVVDGVVLARPGQAFADLFDVERVEVLRGPQGTLFGKNASAGVINVTTRRPGDTFAADLRASLFSDDEYRLSAAFDAPINERIRTRFGGFYATFDGNLTNIFTQEQVNGYENFGGRGVIEFDITEDFFLRINGDYFESNDDCCAEVIGTAPSTPQALAALGPALSAEDEGRLVNQDLVSRTLNQTGGISAELNYTLFDHTLTSITAWRRFDNEEFRDGDFLSAGAPALGVFQLHDNGEVESRQISQEVRLASPEDQRLSYQIGAYYFNLDNGANFTRTDLVCTATTLAVNPLTGVTPCAPGLSTFTNPTSTANFATQFRNYAVFGEFTGRLLDTLRLTFGLRWVRDELDFQHERFNISPEGPGTSGPGVLAGDFATANETAETDVAFKAGVQYDVTPDILTYFTFSQGFKGPAFNVFFNLNAGLLNQQTGLLDPIGAERSNSYEGGVKTSLFDDRVILNLAGYFARYDNFQANNFTELNGAVITTFTNAGEVETKGFELDFLANPLPNWNLAGGLAYTDADIVAFFVPPGAPANASTRAGDPLPLSPDWKLNIRSDYTLPFELPVDVTLGTSFTWQSSQLPDLSVTPAAVAANPALRIDSYGLWDMSLAVADKDGKYRATLLVRNITDNSFPSLITPGGPAGSLRFLIPREADRFIGVNLQTKF